MHYVAFTVAAFLIGLAIVNMWVDHDNRRIYPPRLWPVLTGIGGCLLLVIAL